MRPPAIRVLGDPVLRTPTEPVTEFDRALRRLVKTMTAAMHDARGVGLAANQIGVSLAVFVYDVGPDEDGNPRRGHVVNPEVDVLGDEQETADEGCLSIPGHAFSRTRTARARVRGVDEHGEPLDIAGSGVLARCFQHESDHLAGRLFVDGLTGDVRRFAMRQLRDDPRLGLGAG
jgi:peptide deformylase